MRILITNDDGIDSPGIAALVDALGEEHELFVVAPSSNRSGFSHAITTDGAITMEKRDGFSVPAYACSGTPADCAFLGVTAFDPRPELVVSGINFGPNLADDVNYSGTVAGAIEASLLGIAAIAVSLAADHEQLHARLHWKTAAQIVRRCTASAREHLRFAESYWNLNVPNLPIDQVRGIAVTRLGRKGICGRMVGEDELGQARYFRAWESPFATDRDTHGTDIAAVDGGFASVTPLLVDRTAHVVLPTIGELESVFTQG